jgi:hypothetical protein
MEIRFVGHSKDKAGESRKSSSLKLNRPHRGPFGTRRHDAKEEIRMMAIRFEDIKIQSGLNIFNPDGENCMGLCVFAFKFLGFPQLL